MNEETRIIMRCPECCHTSVTTNKDGTTFCRYCGYRGKISEFKKEFNIKLHIERSPDV